MQIKQPDSLSITISPCLSEKHIWILKKNFNGIYQLLIHKSQEKITVIFKLAYVIQQLKYFETLSLCFVLLHETFDKCIL